MICWFSHVFSVWAFLVLLIVVLLFGRTKMQRWNMNSNSFIAESYKLKVLANKPLVWKLSHRT